MPYWLVANEYRSDMIYFSIHLAPNVLKCVKEHILQLTIIILAIIFLQKMFHFPITLAGIYLTWKEEHPVLQTPNTLKVSAGIV